jgi:hypothetical protein
MIWVALAIVSPLLLAGILLLWRPWVPVLDMAMTELRVRDVGGAHTPLIGLPGRIGNFPDQGSHPGPWSFYLVAPFYRLAGSTAWGMEFASIMINIACIAALITLGRRRFGMRGAFVFAAMAAVAVRGYGLTVLTHPWNPYFPVLLWLVALVAAWFVISGDHDLAVVVVITSTIAAQTHVPYLVNAIALNALVLGWLCWSLWRSRSAHGARTVRPVVAMLGIGGLLWVPPVIQQLRGESGNIAKLLRHFATAPPEDPIGVRAGFELLTQHLDVVALAKGLLVDHDAFVGRAGQVGSLSTVGAIVLVLWVISFAVAAKRRHRDLLALHGVIAAMLATGWFSMSRIFGKVWFYLTLWMSGIAMLVVLALMWTTWLLLLEHRARRHEAPPADRWIGISAVAVAALVTTLSLVAAIGHQVPERTLGEDVRQILPTVTAALEAHTGAATGKQGSYVVFWQEAIVPGAQGYALMNELERRGYRVGVHPTWRVPATPHRVRVDGEYDAEVHVVSGAWIDEWRTRLDQGYVEVLEYDGRTDAERNRFAVLEDRVDTRLEEIGRADLIPIVDTNIFGASLDPDLPDDIVEDLAEMILLGEPVAVFIAPAGSTY